MGVRDYVRAIIKNWWIVALAVFLATGVGVLVTLSAAKMYATTVTFFVKTPSDQLLSAAQGDTFGQKRVNSYVQLATTDRITNPVITSSKVDLTPDELAAEITASGDLNTVLLKVVVTDPLPVRSLAIGQSIAKDFITVVEDLESSTTGGDSTVRLELVSGPKLDPKPVSPRPALNYGIAAVVGILVGVGLAVIRELMDRTVSTLQALERLAGAPVMGIIPFDQTARRNPLILDGDAKSVRAEAFRQLRTNLEFVDIDAPVKTLVITSSIADEGKSSTATNLAVIFAEAGKQVLLIEADLRRPRVADYLGLEGSIGLTNVLVGQAHIEEVLQPWGRGGLTVLPSGSIPPNPSELLGSKSMVELLSRLATKFDLVVIDTPPLLPVTDAAIVAAHADGALLVVRHGATTRQQVALAVAALRKVDARFLGTLLNMAPMKRAEGYKYGYGYGYAEYSSQSTRPDLALIDSQPPNARPIVEGLEMHSPIREPGSTILTRNGAHSIAAEQSD